jgi:hypothetical protein
MSRPHRLLVFLRREALWLALGLGFGFIALPWLIYAAGSRLLGPFEGGSAAALTATLYGDFLRLRPAAWILLLGPLAMLFALRLCVRAMRAR